MDSQLANTNLVQNAQTQIPTSTSSTTIVKRKIEINGYKIDDRIYELTKECQFAEARLQSLIDSNLSYDLISQMFSLVLFIKQKLSKWIEIKHLYELNVNVILFDNATTLTLTHVTELVKQTQTIIEIYERLLSDISNNKENKDSFYKISTIYGEYRKQKRLFDYYDNAIKIAKTQIGVFELDEKMFDD